MEMLRDDVTSSARICVALQIEARFPGNRALGNVFSYKRWQWQPWKDFNV